MELNTDLTISTSTTDYRGDIMISTQDLSIAANREVVQFKTDLTISAYSDGTLKSEMKTDLCFSNNTMLFSIIDYAEVRKSILYFSKFFNTNFEEAYLWDILAQGTSEQINKSHLADVYTAINNVAARLNNFLEGTDADDIINTWKELQDFLKGISGVQDLYTLIKSMVTLDNLLPILKDHFIRKDQDDTTAYNITFANTADEGGNGITLGDKFVPDSYGGRLNAYYDSNHTLQTKLEIDYLKVRKKATFTELTIEELKSVGGCIILSPAAMKCSLVDTKTILQEDIDKITQSNMYYDSETQTYKPYCAVGDVVFRCYFTDKDEDGTKIYNQFVAGDQARCQTFNVSEIKDYTETADTTGSRYYWRLVVNVGENYIDLSQNDKDDLSDVPVVGDDIVQFGHRHDPTRQAAQVLSAYGTEAPSHIMYQGVGSTMTFTATVEGEQDTVSGPYSLYGKDVYGLYYNVDSTTPQNSKMKQYTYGDWYVGTRDQDHRHDDVTYVKFDTKNKQLTLRGVMVQSQYGDTQPIKFYRGIYDDKAIYYYMDYVTYTNENGATGTYLHTGRTHTTGVKPTDTDSWTPEAIGTSGTPGEPAYAAYIDNPNDSIMVGSDCILNKGVTVTTYTGVSIPYGTENLNLTAANCVIPEELQDLVKLNSKNYIEADKEYRFAFVITGDGTTKLETNYKIVLTVTGTTPDGTKEISRSAVYTLMFINKGTDGETIQIVPSTTEVKYYPNATKPYFSPSAITCKVMRKIGTQSYSECTLPNVILRYIVDSDTNNVYTYTGQILIPSSSDSDSTHFTDRVDFTLYYDNIIIGSQPVTILSDGKNGENQLIMDFSNDSDYIMVGSDGVLNFEDSSDTMTTTTDVSMFDGSTPLDLSNCSVVIPKEIENVVSYTLSEYNSTKKNYTITFTIKDSGTTVLPISNKITITLISSNDKASASYYNLVFVRSGKDGETYKILPSSTEVKYYTNESPARFSPTSLTCKILKKQGSKPYTETIDSNITLKYKVDDSTTEYTYTIGTTTLTPSANTSSSTTFTDKVTFLLYWKENDTDILIDMETVFVMKDGTNGSDGDSSITIYKNSSTKPDTPASGTTIPADWRLTTLAVGTYSMGVDTSQTISGKYTKSFSLGKGTGEYAAYYKIAGLSGIHNTMQCVKLVFKGNTLSSYTVRVDSYTSSEATYDNLYIGKLDSAPSISNSGYTQATSGIGKSNTCYFSITNTNTHFIYIYYVKDVSTTAGEDAAYFKITFTPDTIVEEGTLYSCHGTKDGKTGIYTWEEPQVSIYGNDPVYSYWGDWDKNTIYRGNSEIRDIVSIPIKNSEGAITGRTFYRALIDAGNIPTGISPESSTGLNYWMKIPKYSSMATDLLLADQAIINKVTVNQLRTADDGARIHIRENILSLYDGSNKERLQIIGDTISDTGTPSAYGFASFGLTDGIVATSGGTNSKAGSKIDTVASFSVFSDGTSVTIPTITLSCDSSTEYNGYADNISLNIWIQSSDGSTTIASEEEQGIENFGSISLTGASYTLNAGDYKVVLGVQYSIGVDYDADNPYSQDISFTANAEYSGNISVGVASASDNKISIGANGMIINLGNDFAVQMLKTDTDGSKIVFLGSNGGSTIGFRITSSGVQYNQGSGWVTLSNSGGSSGSSGTVTSVGMSVPTGFSISPATITTSGKFILSFASGYSLPLTSKQYNWDSAYNAMHSHSNKTVLDSITSDKITAWDEAASGSSTSVSERYCVPRLTMISGVIDGTMTKTLKVEHPYYGTGKGEVILMVHSKKNGGRPAQTASYSKYTGRRSKKGWCEARGVGDTPFTQVSGSIDAYNALPLFILQHYVRRNGYTTSTMTMESWRKLAHAAKNTYEGFDGDRSDINTTVVHSVKHKRFGIAIRWENPEFNALVDSSRTLSAHTMMIEGKKRYLYSAVAPIECYLDCGEIVFGIVTPGTGV